MARAEIQGVAKIKQPVATNVPAGVVDIYPTLVDLLQIKIPQQVQPLDGISLVPLLDGNMKAELEAWQLSVIRSYHGRDYPEGKLDLGM